MTYPVAEVKPVACLSARGRPWLVRRAVVRRGSAALLTTIGILLAVLALMVAVWWWMSSAAAKRELAAQQELNAMGILAVMDAEGSHVASVNVSMIPADQSLDRAVELMADLTELKSFDASRTSFGDDHAAMLVGVQSLNTVTLNNSALTDAGLAHLAKLPNLEALNVTLNRISNSGVDALRDASQLKVLDLSGTEVSGNLAPLASLPSLTWLALRNCTLEDDALDVLTESASLRQLSLESTTVSVEAIQRLKTTLPELTVGTGSLEGTPETPETPSAESAEAEAEPTPASR